MDRVILQIPMSKTLRKQAETVAHEEGFSSLQEPIRLFLNRYAKHKLTFDVHAPEEITDLSPRAEKRFKKAIEDIKAGRNIYKPKDADEFLKMLRA